MASMLFTVLNIVALIGWAVVALMTVVAYIDAIPPSANCMKLTFVCECLCCIDIVRIALGQLRGDLILGLDVHYTRQMMLFFTLPHPDMPVLTVQLILLAWSATEVARYPMVLFPSVPALKAIRYAVPLVTFPLGAGTEAYAAFVVLQATPSTALKLALGMIIIINCIGCPVWYPSMARKVGRSLKPVQAADKAKRGD